MKFKACPYISSKAGAYIVATLEIIFNAFYAALAIAGSVKPLKDNSKPKFGVDSEERFVSIVTVLLTVLGLLFSIMLMVGICKSWRRMMVAWMILEIIFIVAKFLKFLQMLIILHRSAALYMVFLLASIYFLAVIYVHYRELKAMERPADIEMRSAGIQGQGQGQCQVQGQAHIGWSQNQDSQLGYGVEQEPLNQHKYPNQSVPMYLPPTYESGAQKSY